ncbi:hypothetical protein [Arthrobacter humicola]
MEYRKWETLFPEDAYSRRMACLLAAGLPIDDMESDVRRSLTLVTEVEVMTRLLSTALSENRRVELDAIAVTMRIARSMAQRRGRGTETKALQMADFADKLLSSTQLETELRTAWKQAVWRLSRTDLLGWTVADIHLSATHAPSRMAAEILARECAGDSTWVTVVRDGTALDWVARDLMLLFKPGGFSTYHVGPISDLLYEHGKDQAGAQADLDKRDVIVRSARVMDSYAEQLHPYLAAGERSVPQTVKNHFLPPFDLARRLVSSLTNKKIV